LLTKERTPGEKHRNSLKRTLPTLKFFVKIIILKRPISTFLLSVMLSPRILKINSTILSIEAAPNPNAYISSKRLQISSKSSNTNINSKASIIVSHSFLFSPKISFFGEIQHSFSPLLSISSS